MSPQELQEFKDLQEVLVKQLQINKDLIETIKEIEKEIIRIKRFINNL
jgi:hypothetical protein